jgi:branched-chain amino acid aminotransferase
MSTDHLIYLDGKFVPAREAKVSVFDHGLLYGDGVFEGIRAYDGVVFQLDAHLDRLYRSAKVIWLNIPLTKEAMRDAVLETLRRNKLQNGYIRLVVTRGEGDLGLDPKNCARPTTFIIAIPAQPLYGEDAKRRGLRMIVATTRRNTTDSTSHEIKSLNYLNSILAKIEANTRGVNDAIMLDSRGFVAEASVMAVFIVKDGELLTPPLHASLLASITRHFIIGMASELRLTVKETDITLFQLRTADEVLTCGTFGEINPVVEIDGQPVGDGKPGPITQRLIEGFIKRRSDPRYGTPIQGARK